MARGTDPQALPVLSKLLAGSFSGVTMTLVTYPLDLARTRVTADMAAKESDRNFIGLTDCLKQTVRTEGTAALYKGLMPSLGSIIPYVGIGFTAYDEIKLMLNSCSGHDSAGLGFAERLAAGAGSGVFAQSITYPIDTVRRRMQVRRTAATPTIDGWICSVPSGLMSTATVALVAVAVADVALCAHVSRWMACLDSGGSTVARSTAWLRYFVCIVLRKEPADFRANRKILSRKVTATVAIVTGLS